MSRKYFIETYGCQMNYHDSEQMSGLLEAAGYDRTDDDRDADVVVINGTSPGTAPVIDPVATVVLAADTSNVDTVIIGGKVQKRNGKLSADWDASRAKVEASSDHLREELAKQKGEG